MKTLTCVCLFALGLSSATIAEAAPDFTLSATPSEGIVEAGHEVSYSISIASSGGTIAQPVKFTAEGVPPGATVSFSPSVIVLGKDQSTTMTIRTREGDSPTGQRVASASLAMPLVAALVLLPLGVGRRTRVRVSCWVAITWVTGGLLGCETGGVAVPLSETVASQTTYLVTVIGSAGPIQHAVTVEMTVQTGSGFNT